MAGKFFYTPPAGRVLSPGIQTLSTTFTPLDMADYTTAKKSVTLAVDKAPAITSAARATFTVGKCGVFIITTTAGFPAATTLSESGKLPSGVNFTTGSNGTAFLSGVPAAGSGGVYSLTIIASNASSRVTTQAFTLTVDQAPAITSAANTTFTVGNAGSFTVTTRATRRLHSASMGLRPAVSPSPPGATARPPCTAHPPRAPAATYIFTIIASNSPLPAAPQTFKLAVDKTPAITARPARPSR